MSRKLKLPGAPLDPLHVIRSAANGVGVRARPIVECVRAQSWNLPEAPYAPYNSSNVWRIWAMGMGWFPPKVGRVRRPYVKTLWVALRAE